jgi:branched-chain amino acid transport system permease protein
MAALSQRLRGVQTPGASAPAPLAFLALVAVGLAAPFAIYPVFLMKVWCFGLFACAFNLLLGYVGLLSFGHAAFFGAAAYATAYAAKVWGIPAVAALLLAPLAAGLLGLFIGGLAIRRQGIYFAMITLSLAQMFYFVCMQAPFTGGEDGIQGVPRGSVLGLLDLRQTLAMYFVVFVLCLGGFLLIARVIHSPMGQVLRAIRDNETRAVSLGYKPDEYKLIAFVLSAALSGLAGGLHALVFQLASLTNVHWSQSGEVVLMTLLGGLGTVYGPLAGALILVMLEQYLAPFGAWLTVAQGAIFIACVLVFRRGVVGEVRAWWTRRREACAGRERGLA